MNPVDVSEPIKYCVWLNCAPFFIPLEILLGPPEKGCYSDIFKINCLEDLFQLFVVKISDTVLKVAVFRERLPYHAADEGYALRFYFSIIGFDEETQCVIMKHDDRKVTAAFSLPENIQHKIASGYAFFDVFTVVQMLEFKSLDKSDPRKFIVDQYESYLKFVIKKEDIKKIGCIIESPELNDIFTGRLPPRYIRTILLNIESLSQNLAKLSAYLEGNYDSIPPDFEVDKLLNYIGLSNEEGSIPIEEAVDQYLATHRLGLECFNKCTSDYLMHLLDKECNVLDILQAALMVQDEYLIEQSIIYFLRHFREITRSPKFKYFGDYNGLVTRYLIHSARIWVCNNDVFIPGWRQSTIPTTEL